MPDGTAKVAIGSALKRKQWMMQGLIQKAATSYFAPYTGASMGNIVQTAATSTAKEGHTVTFDMNGNIAAKAIRGNQTAKGTGVQKKEFSSTVVVQDWRYVVNNGTAFDGVDIGDLGITQHADSRSRLGDLWIRSKDQAFFDLAQQGTTHGIDLGSAFTFDKLLDIENVVKNGTGFNTTNGITKRMPLKPFMTVDGKPIWLFVIDTAMKTLLMKSSGAQSVLTSADIRGNQNRLFSGVLGKIGNFVIVETDQNFFGETVGDIVDAEGYYNFDNTEVEFAGLRQYDTVNAVWTGEEGFDPESTLKSRGIIFGAGAIQFGNGMSPDYKFEETDFAKFSESAMEVWCAAKLTQLTAENSDYKEAKVAGYSFGTIFVDVQVQA